MAGKEGSEQRAAQIAACCSDFKMDVKSTCSLTLLIAFNYLLIILLVFLDWFFPFSSCLRLFFSHIVKDSDKQRVIFFSVPRSSALAEWLRVKWSLMANKELWQLKLLACKFKRSFKNVFCETHQNRVNLPMHNVHHLSLQYVKLLDFYLLLQGRFWWSLGIKVKQIWIFFGADSMFAYPLIVFLLNEFISN